jgi:hypothetical protein
MYQIKPRQVVEASAFRSSISISTPSPCTHFRRICMIHHRHCCIPKPITTSKIEISAPAQHASHESPSRGKTLKALLRLDLFSSSSSSIFPHRLMKPPFSHLSVPCFYNRHPSNEPTSLVSKPWWKGFFSLCRY